MVPAVSNDTQQDGQQHRRQPQRHDAWRKEEILELIPVVLERFFFETSANFQSGT